MAHRFHKHYTREEARALLPQIRTWLRQLNEQRALAEKLEKRLGQSVQAGEDRGGETVNRLIKAMAAIKEGVQEFEQREIQIKDLERGLIDFPALIGNREVFLCWEQDEEDIEFWHDLESGYAGRERL
jgi:hypothetical protein